MKKTRISFKSVLLLACPLVILTACSDSASDNAGTTADSATHDSGTHAGAATTTDTTSSSMAEATLSGTFADTTVNGTARFERMDNGRVKMTLNMSIPAKANKSVAVHLHEHGTCADTAMAAGGHWNPTNTAHGKWGEGQYHVGDIGNVKLDGQGNGTMELETDLWSIGGGDAQKNILNKTVMVHGGVDDYKSQPAGNSGPRIGCGVITARNQ
ncbi:MAG TPA: superoxide dismutase family protein [Flavisolibacter sp.]|jgi:Cu-Zn family superoxide dismutase|nr:superoxide dismutase family protein [Flavisolibacter sp.]